MFGGPWVCCAVPVAAGKGKKNYSVNIQWKTLVKQTFKEQSEEAKRVWLKLTQHCRQ